MFIYVLLFIKSLYRPHLIVDIDIDIDIDIDSDSDIDIDVVVVVVVVFVVVDVAVVVGGCFFFKQYITLLLKEG